MSRKCDHIVAFREWTLGVGLLVLSSEQELDKPQLDKKFKFCSECGEKLDNIKKDI